MDHHYALKFCAIFGLNMSQNFALKNSQLYFWFLTFRQKSFTEKVASCGGPLGKKNLHTSFLFECIEQDKSYLTISYLGYKVSQMMSISNFKNLKVCHVYQLWKTKWRLSRWNFDKILRNVHVSDHLETKSFYLHFPPYMYQK